ncbi:MAG: AAA family ATPase [Actinobacteria bacterium]|nr:AAA family ATPase [Actinomycetota bacterium]
MERESPSSRKSSQGERKQVTVLFADVAGFTSLSEELDPEEVRDLMEPCLDIMSDVVHAYEGTVAQFTGDGIMALFGAPVAFEDAPVRAVRAAMEMQQRLSAYAEELSGRGISFEVRIGLNTGLVVVGSMGSGHEVEYTAVGDTVNLASRMESAASPGTVLVSDNTYRLVRGYFEFEPLGELEVKGKKKPVTAYRALATKGARTRMEASLPSSLSPFVGRSGELSQLSECFEKARSGSGQVVGMVGEPGVGKSRLLLEFRELLPEDECTYLEGGCIHYGEAIAYLPILRILRNYFGIGEGEGETNIKQKLEERLSSLNGQLAHILPPLQELLSLSVDDDAYLSLEPAQRRERVFDAIRYLLVAESQQRPLVMAIEDLHWMDRTSEELLSSFIDSIPGASILLLLLYRPEYTPAWVSKTYYRQILVDQLSDEPSTMLVEAILCEGEVSPSLSDFIVGRTAGNPLFIEELTRGLLEAGSIIKDNEHYILGAPPSDIHIPETIHGIIASRLDRLPEELKETLQVASTIGRQFSNNLLEKVTGIGKSLSSYLLELQSLEFIYEKALFPEPQYIFKHALTQEVAYESLLLKRRREIHARIGRVIEELCEETLEDHYETLAYHYSRSDDAERAIHYLKLSGDKSARNYANWEASRFYREAIQILDSLPENKERNEKKLEVCLAIQSPLELLSFPEGSLEILREAERLAEELGDEESFLAVYTMCASYHVCKGDTALGLEYLEKVTDAAEEIKDVESMSLASVRVCTVLFHAGDFLGTASVSRRALELIEEKHRENDIFSGGQTTYAMLCGWCGNALGVLGFFEEAGAVFYKGLEVSREMDDAGVGWIEFMQNAVSFYSGDFCLVEHARRASGVFEKMGYESLIGFTLSFLGLGHYFFGDYEKAKDYAERGFKRQRKIGLPVLLPFACYASSLILLALGNLEGAAKHAREAVRLSQEFETKAYEGLGWIALGRVVGEADPSGVETAEEYIREGISIAEKITAKPISAHGHLFLGEVFEIASRREEALENLRKAEGLYLDMSVAPDSYWLTRTREALARMQPVS